MATRRLRHIAVLVGLAASPALADNPGQPMSFGFSPKGYYQRPIIQADGDITGNTPQRFIQFLDAHQITPELEPPDRPVVYLTSLGGNLGAGIELGTIIRKYNLNTQVAATTPVAAQTRQALAQNGVVVSETCPDAEERTFQQMMNGTGSYRLSICQIQRNTGEHASYCISACTVAFLGGVTRNVAEGSAYAVHQFSAECQSHPEAEVCKSADQAIIGAQQISAELAHYVEEMGVSQAFLSLMVQADPSHTNVLPEATMRQYRIVYVPRRESWEVKRSELGGLALVYANTNTLDSIRAEFACAPQNGRPQLIVMLTSDHYYDRDKALAARNFEFRFFPGKLPERKYLLTPDEISRYPYPLAHSGVGLIIRTSPRLLDALQESDRFQVTDRSPNASDLLIVYANVPIDQEKLNGYIAGCH